MCAKSALARAQNRPPPEQAGQHHGPGREFRDRLNLKAGQVEIEIEVLCRVPANVAAPGVRPQASVSYRKVIAMVSPMATFGPIQSLGVRGTAEVNTPPAVPVITVASASPAQISIATAAKAANNLLTITSLQHSDVLSA
jgi:hypothetical protein